MAGERTEQATPQRRDKARREGDIVVSRELSSAAAMLAGVVTLGWAGPRMALVWRGALAGCLALATVAAWEPARLSQTEDSLRGLVGAVMLPAGVVAAAVALAALVTGVAQTGGVNVHPQAVGFKLSRINPLSNAKNLFSLRAGARLGKSLVPAGVIGVLVVERLARSFHMPPLTAARMTGMLGDGFYLLEATAWLQFAWALVDYLVEWRSREQRLRMSREEMREEFKESEGNPQIRGRIRNLQRAARRRRLKADVARAAVVITNPTHYAVALAFDFERMDAPRVMAKGRNLLAEEIKEQARWAGVPITENPPLARSLYRLVEPGESIPAELYAAVASILAFLYRQRVEEQMRRARRPQAAGSAPGPVSGNGSGGTGSGANGPGGKGLGVLRSGWTRAAGSAERSASGSAAGASPDTSPDQSPDKLPDKPRQRPSASPSGTEPPQGGRS